MIEGGMIKGNDPNSKERMIKGEVIKK